jgi:hypothetical protein
MKDLLKNQRVFFVRNNEIIPWSFFNMQQKHNKKRLPKMAA